MVFGLGQVRSRAPGFGCILVPVGTRPLSRSLAEQAASLRQRIRAAGDPRNSGLSGS